mgnify:CR=1 FL=1
MNKCILGKLKYNYILQLESELQFRTDEKGTQNYQSGTEEVFTLWVRILGLVYHSTSSCQICVTMSSYYYFHLESNINIYSVNRDPLA